MTGRIALVAALCAAALAGCSANPPTPGPAAPALPAATGAERLAGDCPETVAVQESWEPEAEHGVLYQLVGPGHTIDAERKRVSGPLVIDGRDTGVRIEIRAGGAAIGFTAVPAQMYLDRSLTLGAVHTDLAIGTSANQPVTAVVAPLNKSPQMLMWDPATHPDWRTFADIGASGAKVLTSKANNSSALLVAEGLIKPDQVDTGYTGAPTRFVADPTIAQDGYATMEPYIYQHEIPSWNKPIRYQLHADAGYSIYPEALSVRTGELDRLSGCLTKLVPIIQRAQRDYLRDPARANRLIVETVAKYDDGWSYSAGVAGFAANAMRELGIVADDRSGPLGGIDPARMQATIDTFAPILTRSGASVRPGLTAADLATARFLDPSITLN
ncbi:nitrate ABC transporter substrate-binding protein [Pseudonocardia eucalypti]|uniref:Nitrate ABC transporter substrate-binding protein n=1 Tax=Pseudonocardia eucalypti TaxID=648755 RepID=A0ABP9Q9Z5_9PSEU|nr:hypothetical protein [Pseudonocardia eucalypti]